MELCVYFSNASRLTYVLGCPSRQEATPTFWAWVAINAISICFSLGKMKNTFWTKPQTTGFSKTNWRFVSVYKRFRKVLKILKASEIFLAVGRDTFPWGSITKKLMTVKVSSNELKDKEIRKDLKLQRLKIIEDQLNKNG